MTTAAARCSSDLADLADLLARAYPAVPVGQPDGLSRRRFLQLMGASLTLAGAAGVTGCQWGKSNIMPESKRPEGHVPGATQQFATAMDLGGVALGLLATSFEGRPIKLDGNPQHPENPRGGTTAYAQASIFELYDPDRSRHVVERQHGTARVRTADELQRFADATFPIWRQDGGRGLAILCEASSSPTLAALKQRLLEAASATRWLEYEPLSRDNEREGARLAFGVPLRPHFALDRARALACFDADLLREHPDAVRLSAAFAAARTPDSDRMSRLYAIESQVSATGAVADHRLPLRGAQLKPLLMALEAAVLRGLGDSSEGPTAPQAGFLADEGVAAFIAALTRDLLENRGASLIAVGPRQPPEVHALAHRLNARLGNFGATVTFTQEREPARPTHVDAMTSLTRALGSGEIRALVILGGNPVFDAPADLDFAAALAKAESRLRLALYEDETSRLSTLHIPRAHFLECWGDARSYDGTISIIQPLIEPLHGGRSPVELLALLAGDTLRDGQELVRRTFQESFGADDERWRRAVADGFVAGSADPVVTPELRSFAVTPVAPQELEGPEGGAEALEVSFVPDTRLYDGRYANIGVLQEQPDFVTKLTWDNAALMAPASASELGVATGDLVRIELGGRTLELPVLVVPGQAVGAVTLSLGGGRTAAGQVGGLVGGTQEEVQSVGFDVYRLRTRASRDFTGGAKVTPVGGTYRLALTQNRFEIDGLGTRAQQQRLPWLAREATLSELQRDPEIVKHVVGHPPLESLWKEPEYRGHRWGMAIDLNRCTGCGACMTACQAENNVPIVGKEMVLKNREMHWIRIDRYFKGDPSAPAVIIQPVTCHHCELAPCETVCPVNATVHSDEGLNQQVYNRCVGTRYCANNCPYKVRRFNYLNFQKRLDDPDAEVMKLGFNPEVTVRSRGVMEKCTYCVQRIQSVKIAAKNAQRDIKDGEIVPACAQACPTGAIVFGDLGDPASAVCKQHKDPRAYAMLAELNIKPRTAYLARVRNPNSLLAKV